MIIHTINKGIEILNDSGTLGKLILNDDHIEIVYLKIEPGKEIPIHSLPIKVIFFAITGEGQITIDGKSSIIKKNMFIECFADTERSWKNNSQNALELLVLKEILN